MFAEGDLTCDGFLNGRVRLWQPKDGFRSSVDAVLLAAAVPAQAGDSALDLGCGAGAAVLCLGCRVPGMALAGLELQADYVALARRNAAANGMALEVWEGDAADPPKGLRAQVFDHVLTNPPYFRPGGGTAARDAGREAALREAVPLGLWIGAALRRVRPGGDLVLIQSADRLAEALAALPGHGAGAEVLPVAPRRGRAATRVILRARKGGRAAFRLLAPLVLHEGAEHLRDAEDLTGEARDVLRSGAPIEWAK